MGESFGAYHIGQDQVVLPHVTSANIACGFHAGDPTVIVQRVTMALEFGVSIGAHPGFPDLQGFGRRPMKMNPRELYDMLLYQIAAVGGITKALGGELQHVKPHGALYNMAAVDSELAEAIAEAVYKIAPTSILFGLAESEMIKAGRKLGLKTANEVFADRTYQASGELTPRTHSNAVIHSTEQAIAQVLQMLTIGKVTTVDNIDIPIQADTLCLHGDHPNVVTFVKSLEKALQEQQISIEAVGKWLT